jgi:hypothetical protein
MLCLTLTAVGRNRRLRGHRSVSRRSAVPALSLAVIASDRAFDRWTAVRERESVVLRAHKKTPAEAGALIDEKSRDDQ